MKPVNDDFLPAAYAERIYSDRCCWADAVGFYGRGWCGNLPDSEVGLCQVHYLEVLGGRGTPV